ncbi:MAG TPA: hypothetical protein VKR24_01545 [Candidatus Limnocylindrales bacterium]|nr:hypothetical protein [Candidatus Limnocylindrales bacterium]
MSWRFALITAAVIVALVIGWNLLLGFVYPTSRIYDPATLPGRIHVCNRDWAAAGEPMTGAEVRVRFDQDPVIVSPGLLAPCPQAPCSRGGDEPGCNAIVFVRVGPDSFVGFGLLGSP